MTRTVAVFSPLIGGGVRHHVDDFICNIKRDVNVIDVRYRDHIIFFTYIRSEEKIIEKVICGYDTEFLMNFFKKNKVSILHIEHFIYAPKELLDFYRCVDIPYVVTIHDYYTICPKVNIYKNGKVCNYLNESECKMCTNENISITSWRKNFAYILQNAKHVICPSNCVVDYYKKIYPHLSYKVIPNVEKERSVHKRTYGNSNLNTVKVGIIGKIDEKKGASTIMEVAKSLKAEDIQFYLFGTLDISYKKLPQNLHVLGKYNDEVILEDIMEYNIDFFWFPGRVPETYCYALTIPIWGGYPILAYDIGAIGERVKNNLWGEVYNENIGLEDLKNKLLNFKNNCSVYKSHLKVDNVSYPSIDEFYACLTPTNDIDCDYLNDIIKLEDKKIYKRKYSLYDLYFYFKFSLNILKKIVLLLISNHLYLFKQLFKQLLKRI